jgi:anti-sigma28 factor (negative regulator of flagellin synthesis)
MALSKSGKAGSNVSKMDDARNKRTQSSLSPKSAAAIDEVEQPPPLAPQLADKAVEKPAPKSDIKPKVSNRRFDKVKVDRLKSEIANGDYEINYLNVADKFIEHERYA